MYTSQSDAPHLPVPMPAQLAWQQAELGVIFHYDLHIFDDIRYRQHENRSMQFDPGIFNPTKLDTDQWAEAAAACGARFALITASHETGFRLWQSDANPYSLKAASWGDGKRDVVGEFIESCRRIGIQPGVYMGARWNGQLGMWDFRATDRSPLSQREYNHLIEQEVEEICSRYGDLFELWFDGGILSPDHGGPEVLPIFERHQPDCLFYHSDQRRDARWGGTESGTVGYPCWATVDLPQIATGMWGEQVQNLLRHGDPHGRDWCPAMSDAPLRNHEWFWEPDDESKLYSLDALVNMYYQSLGRNSTLILGATPDADGLVPEADMQRLREMGTEIRRRFGTPIAQTSGTGAFIELPLESPARVGHVVIMEDIQQGERVRSYVVEGWTTSRTWEKLCEGTCIGHKRIEQIPITEMSKVRLRIAESTAEPQIQRLEVYS